MLKLFLCERRLLGLLPGLLADPPALERLLFGLPKLARLFWLPVLRFLLRLSGLFVWPKA